MKLLVCASICMLTKGNKPIKYHSLMKCTKTATEELKRNLTSQTSLVSNFGKKKMHFSQTKKSLRFPSSGPLKASSPEEGQRPPDGELWQQTLKSLAWWAEAEKIARDHRKSRSNVVMTLFPTWDNDNECSIANQALYLSYIHLHRQTFLSCQIF